MATLAISPPSSPLPRLNAEQVRDPLQTNQIKLAYLGAMRPAFGA